ncbi:unnamed protein product [Ectocarpus sp. 8 AP-2014]
MLGMNVVGVVILLGPRLEGLVSKVLDLETRKRSRFPAGLEPKGPKGAATDGVAPKRDRADALFFEPSERWNRRLVQRPRLPLRGREDRRRSRDAPRPPPPAAASIGGEGPVQSGGRGILNDGRCSSINMRDEGGRESHAARCGCHIASLSPKTSVTLTDRAKTQILLLEQTLRARWSAERHMGQRTGQRAQRQRWKSGSLVVCDLMKVHRDTRSDWRPSQVHGVLLVQGALVLHMVE